MNEPREKSTVADNPRNQSILPTAETWQWAFSYLREDIQNLRSTVKEDIQDLRTELRELRRELTAEIRSTRTWTLTGMLAMGSILAALIKL